MKPTEQQVYEAIKKIVADTKSFKTSLNYAVHYCWVGLHLSGEELRVQCLYILNNIQHWRHPDAKAVRDVLKQFTKQ